MSVSCVYVLAFCCWHTNSYTCLAEHVCESKQARRLCTFNSCSYVIWILHLLLHLSSNCPSESTGPDAAFDPSKVASFTAGRAGARRLTRLYSHSGAEGLVNEGARAHEAAHREAEVFLADLAAQPKGQLASLRLF